MREHYYKIEWHANAQRQLNKIKEQNLKNQIFEIIEAYIAPNPLVGKPLSNNFSGVRSFRFGILRILYKIYKDRLVIVVLRVEHRKDVYRRH